MLTRDTFDYLIYAVIAIGSILAVGRLYQDLTRPLPEDELKQKPEQPK
ncbi:MAG: hypothetical protein HY862_14020 [Chloroflexi bacterium]|nr:hypothetical protein [Chloroflexota bacterium]